MKGKAKRKPSVTDGGGISPNYNDYVAYESTLKRDLEKVASSISAPILVQARIPAARKTELQELPYTDYLYTPEWRQIRKGAIEVAGKSCCICNKETSRVHVHHRRYPPRGTESVADLMVLCEKCHKIVHEINQPAASATTELVDRFCAKWPSTVELTNADGVVGHYNIIQIICDVLATTLASVSYDIAQQRLQVSAAGVRVEEKERTR